MTAAASALDVAAPSAQVDPLSPWIDPTSRSDRALAAGFWVSFHGLSAFAHGAAIFFALFATLLPVPFLASMCADVKPVEKLPERVELAIVPAPRPAPPKPLVDEGHPLFALAGGDGVKVRTCDADVDCPDDERCVEHMCVLAKKPKPPKKAPSSKKARQAALKDAQEFGMIGLLSSSGSNSAFADVLAKADLEGGIEGGVVGGLVGAQIGEANGVGGLGLRGVGVGGGGTGETIGLGSIGTIGHGGGGFASGTGSGYGVGGAHKGVRLTLGVDDGERAHLERVLRMCDVKAAVHGVVHVDGGRVQSVSSDPKTPCVERRLKSARGLGDGDSPYEIVVGE